MARGTANNEPVVSQAQTEAWDEGFERTFGEGNRSTESAGTWVWDPLQSKLVRPWEKIEPTEDGARALDAPFLVGRFFENVPSPIDGHVFTGRTDYNRYMKEKGLANASDFDKPGGYWDKAEAKRAEGFDSAEHHRDRQDRIGRRLYEVEKMPQAKYDRQVEEVRRKRLERGEKAPDPLVIPLRDRK